MTRLIPPPGPASRLVLSALAALLAASPLPAQRTAPLRDDPHQDMLQRADTTAAAGAIDTRPPAPAHVPELPDTILALGESPLATVYDAIGPDARAFAMHNMTLANPFFEGRVPGSRGNQLAAEYIEHYFRLAGLRPAFGAGDDASYRQTFSRGNELKVEQAALRYRAGDDTVRLAHGRDFTVLGSSGSGTVTGPLVFVGYGINAGKDGYTNFPADTDLTGKIAVVMRFEPMNDQGRSRWSERGWSRWASLDTKLTAAAERGAAAIILVNPPGADDPRATSLISTRDSRPFDDPFTIPIVMASAEAVDRMIQAADPTDGPRRTLRDLRAMFDERSRGPIDLPNAPVTITTHLSYEPITTDNVGAVLPGRGDLADEYIIVGAHYDHVGYGPTGVSPDNQGKLHPGADDNASGTSGLLVLADKLARSYEQLPEGAHARSVLFLAFSAEESGLIGSAYYARNPSIDLEKQAYLMLNMDMIGRLRQSEGLEVQGTQSAEGFYDWLNPFFETFPVEIKHGSEVAGNSDHASFYRKNIPVLFFFTGLHREYHKPGDTAFLINQVGAARVVGLVHDIALAAAQRAEPLKFVPRRREARGARQAEPRAEEPERPRAARRVRFGIMPGSYADDKPGVEVGDVLPASPAEEAGLKAGDRLIKWNGKPVADVAAWNAMLTEHNPGDVVEVTLLRDGAEVTVKVTLTALGGNR